MRKKTKIIVALTIACAGTLVLGACTSDKTYSGLRDQGYSISVKYDVNGGTLASLQASNLVDVYRLEDVNKGVKLLTPDDDRRGTNSRSVSCTGYFLAGWYAHREPRVDASGNPLDEDGNICNISTLVVDNEGNPVIENGSEKYVMLSENGKEQGYMYSDPWDFEKDTFPRASDNVDLGNMKAENGEYNFTLYAAWIPEYTYRIWVENEGEWEEIGKRVFSPIYNPEDMEIEIPVWNEETGAQDFGRFPDPDNRSFIAVYGDKNKSQALESIVHKGSWDPATGVSVNGITDFYAEFDQGRWYHISTAEQFLKNLTTSGCYDIRADLDFTDVAWDVKMLTGSFEGTIQGNNHKFMNISTQLATPDSVYGGLFGRIREGAKFEDVSFENITFNLVRGSRTNGAMFGLFAGELSEKAVMKNVTVSGKLVVGSDDDTVDFVPQYSIRDDGSKRYIYEIGILTGNFVTNGISTDNLTVEGIGKVSVEKDENGRVTATVQN